MDSRIVRFEEKLAQSGLDAFLVTGQNNIYYLTGFWGTESTVFITRNRRIFMTDARYTLIAKEVVEGFDIIETRTALAEVSKIIKEDQLSRVGFDSQVSYAFYGQLTSLSPATEWLPQADFVETLRVIKDKSEIETIRQACQISDRAFLDLLDFIKPGQTTELQVANFLDFQMRSYGASGVSFETIVASGYRSAMPHGVASDKVIQSGESLTLDFGCYYKHYVSDMTRTIHIGHVTDEEREIYHIVLKANQTLIDQAKAGMTYRDFDAIPRQILEDAGYGEFFTHGIGHGIGLDIHENPFFRGSEDKLETGMVVTDEPGIYLPNKYGLRIEDDLVITETGCEVLTKAPKELIVLK
ncbi:Xaa-Pro peptidase family protein [Streptococcus thoraltensis]|uniref:M24 family metallopeptidase n=1 Tax=Streptococcus thoraltensis TaxID=55085 RepID=UPI0003745C5E|nr:Xaa-Pro peptidase family protein [Streptococcus thoraltensis]MDY4761218.1 Xaa-Pro peptidase family protein [Streptococcus thoraltensis]